MADDSSRPKARKTPHLWRLLERFNANAGVVIALLALLLIGALAARASGWGGASHTAQSSQQALPFLSFGAPGDTPTATPTATATPLPAPTDTPVAPTATAMATPVPVSPLASFTSVLVTRGSNTDTFVLRYIIATSPPAPYASAGFSATVCGALAGGSSGVLDSGGALASEWVFSAPCASAPFSIMIDFNGVANDQPIHGSQSIDCPAW